MSKEELAKKAEDTVKRNVCGDCNKCQSHGYFGCDIYKYSRDSFIAGAKAMQEENEQLKQELLTYKNAICNKECAEVWGESERAKILLKATLDLLQKQKESHYVLNLLENTVFYDEAECDGYCLFDDIEIFLTNGGAE